jgi:Mg-chelatase subunit ChlD
LSHAPECQTSTRFSPSPAFCHASSRLFFHRRIRGRIPTQSTPLQGSRTLLVSVEPANTDVSPDDFELKQKGRPVSVLGIRRLGRIPLHYCLLFDVSRSTANTFALEKRLVLTFLDGVVRPGVDHGWVVLFGQEGQESTETGNPELIKNVVSSAVANGGTSLYDAMASCGNRMLKAERETGQELRVMFLFTDGEDNMSHTTREETAETLIQSGLRVYTAAPGSLSVRTKQVMEMFTKVAGGRLFFVSDEKAAARAAEKISSDLDGLVEIVYATAANPSDLVGNRVVVKVRKKGLHLLGPE